MRDFICRQINILEDYGVASVQKTYTADNIIEAAITYWRDNSAWPDQIYDAEAQTDAFKEVDVLRRRMENLQEERDKFAHALALVEEQRTEAYKEIERLHSITRRALALVQIGRTE